MTIQKLYIDFLNKKKSLQVFFLLAVGIIIRVVYISIAPAGLNQDEASIGYDAFSILTTGFDRNGNSFPVHLVSWGNGQNALYAYLSMPFIKLFGLTSFSVRIVNAIMSCVSLFVFYSIFKTLFDKKKATIALAILCICPWSIMAARWGLESNIFPAIFLFGIWFMLKGIILSQKYFILSFLFFAVSLYSYGTSYLIVPLFFVFTLPYLYYYKKINIKYLIISSAVFLTIALPIILFVIINHLNLSTIQLGHITIPKLEQNRTTVVFNLFNENFFVNIVKNIIHFFNILILQTDRNIYNAIPTFGTIYHISLPFFIVGLFNVIKKRGFIKQPHHYIFCSWLLCSILLGISSSVNINRINIIFLPVLYFVALGLIDVSKMLKPEFKGLYQKLFLGLYSFVFILFVGYYFAVFNQDIKSDFSYGLGEAIQSAEKIHKKGTIHLTNNTINMPYIFVCFYNTTNPHEFIETATYFSNNSSDFRNVKQFGKYTFGENHCSTDSVFILSSKDVNLDKYNLSDISKFGNYYVTQSNTIELIH